MSATSGSANAAGYKRVSTAHQKAGGHSLDTQEARFRAYCATHGLTLSHVYEDVERGKRDDRRAYQQLLAECRAGRVSHIVVQFLDRFGRNPREILRRYWELEELGVRIHTTDEDVQEEINLLLKAWVAGQESKRLGERVQGVVQRRHEQGMWTTQVPLGYRMGDDGRLAVVEEKAALVRLIFDLYRSGRMGLEQIAQHLNAQGYRGKQGRPFWQRSVEVILTNLAYLGHTKRKWGTVEHTHPPLVDLTTWQAVQARLAAQRQGGTVRERTVDFPLAGLLRCALCQRWLHTWHPRHRGLKRRPQRFYVCGGRKTGQCTLGIVTAHIVESWLLREMEGVQLHPSRVTPADDDTALLAALERELAEVRDRQKRNHQSYVKGIADEDEAERMAKLLRAEVARLQGRIAQVAADIGHRESSQSITARLHDFTAFWHRAEANEVRQVLGIVLECIEVAGLRAFRLIWRPEWEI